MTELSAKLQTVQELLTPRRLDALILQRVSSLAWATCGASCYINTASSYGVATAVITPAVRYLVTTNIEAPHFIQEEKLAEQGWTVHAAPWHASLDEAVAGLVRGLKVGADGPYPGAMDLSYEMSRLRANLLPEEGERFRELGRRSAAVMDSAIRAVRPGMSEHQIAGLLAAESENRGVQSIVILVAADERIFALRHPLPTKKKLERYAMLVLCTRWRGLVCSLTRLVHFGRLPDEVRQKELAAAQVDAEIIAATRPGKTHAEIFSHIQAAYAETGYANEWQLHHQGGPAGYETREWLATPGLGDVVCQNQVYAWNPSITGVKSEDSILVGEKENEILTAIPGWPTIACPVNGAEIDRPAILEIP